MFVYLCEFGRAVAFQLLGFRVISGHCALNVEAADPFETLIRTSETARYNLDKIRYTTIQITCIFAGSNITDCCESAVAAIYLMCLHVNALRALLSTCVTTYHVATRAVLPRCECLKNNSTNVKRWFPDYYAETISSTSIFL